MNDALYLITDFMKVNREETQEQEEERENYHKEFSERLAKELVKETETGSEEQLQKALYQISSAIWEISRDVPLDKIRFSIHEKRNKEVGGTLKVEIEQINYGESAFMTWSTIAGSAPERLEEKMKIQEMLGEMDRLKETIQKWMDGEDGKENIAEAIERVREITDQLEDLFIIGSQATEKAKEEWKKREERTLRLRRERAERRRKAIAWIKGEEN